MMCKVSERKALMDFAGIPGIVQSLILAPQLKRFTKGTLARLEGCFVGAERVPVKESVIDQFEGKEFWQDDYKSPSFNYKMDFSSEEDGGAWLSSVGILVLLISIALGITALSFDVPMLNKVLPQQYGSKAIAWPGGGFAHLPIAEYRAEVAMRPNVDAAYLYTWNDKVHTQCDAKTAKGSKPAAGGKATDGKATDAGKPAADGKATDAGKPAAGGKATDGKATDAGKPAPAPAAGGAAKPAPAPATADGAKPAPAAAAGAKRAPATADGAKPAPAAAAGAKPAPAAAAGSKPAGAAAGKTAGAAKPMAAV